MHADPARRCAIPVSLASVTLPDTQTVFNWSAGRVILVVRLHAEGNEECLIIFPGLVILIFDAG